MALYYIEPTMFASQMAPYHIVPTLLAPKGHFITFLSTTSLSERARCHIVPAVFAPQWALYHILSTVGAPRWQCITFDAQQVYPRRHFIILHQPYLQPKRNFLTFYLLEAHQKGTLSHFSLLQDNSGRHFIMFYQMFSHHITVFCPCIGSYISRHSSKFFSTVGFPWMALYHVLLTVLAPQRAFYHIVPTAFAPKRALYIYFLYRIGTKRLLITFVLLQVYLRGQHPRGHFPPFKKKS